MPRRRRPPQVHSTTSLTGRGLEAHVRVSSLPSAESPWTFTPLASRKLRQASTFSIWWGAEDSRQSDQRQRDTRAAGMRRRSTFNGAKCLEGLGGLGEDGGIDIVTHKAHHCAVSARPPAQPRAPGRMPHWRESVATYTPRGCWLPRHVTNTLAYIIAIRQRWAHTHTQTDTRVPNLKLNQIGKYIHMVRPHPLAFHNIISAGTACQLGSSCTKCAQRLQLYEGKISAFLVSG